MRRWGLLIAALTFVLAIQFVGPARTNPLVPEDLALERHAAVPDQVAGLLRRACYDCHSPETRWPWYSRVAPVSWLVVSDVDTGREHLNFAAWAAYHRFERADLLDKSCELVTEGKMPLPSYRWMHPDARLGPADIEALCAWTRAEAARLTAPAQ